MVLRFPSRQVFLHGRARLALAVAVMRGLNLAVGLSLMATGLLGALALETPSADRPAGPSEVATTPAGTRMTVRGFLETVRTVAGGAAVGVISDCDGTNVTVFFPRGVDAGLAFRLVIASGKIEFYRGTRELVVESGDSIQPVNEGALVLTPDYLAGQWRALLCREVAITGEVAWAAVPSDDPKAIDLGIQAQIVGVTLRARIHFDTYPVVKLIQGASVTLIGVVAGGADATAPLLHVRA